MRQKSGYTLLELMIGVLIVAILVVIAVPVYTSVREKIEDGEARINLNAIYMAQKIYFQDAMEKNWNEDFTGIYAYDSDALENYGDFGGLFDNEDDNWSYSVSYGDANGFTAVAEHLDSYGSRDGRIIEIDQDGTFTLTVP